MMRFPLVVPLCLLFGWAAPWVCQTYTLPDSGSTINNNPGSTTGGNPNGYNIDAGNMVVYAGGPGLAEGDDGGVTIGSAAAFNSDFVYMSNANEGTVSRIVLPPDGGVPFEEARYYAIVPLDNHGLEPCVGNVCTQVAGATTNDIWHVELSYVVNPNYIIDFCYNDGGYSIVTPIPYNDGGWAVPGDAGYFNDGGWPDPFNDGGYSPDAGIPYNDGGYSVGGDGGNYNDAGYTLPYNDGGYEKTGPLPYNDGGYTLLDPVPYNDGGYTIAYNDGGKNYFLDGGVELRDGSGVYTLPYNDGGYNEDSGVPENDGGYAVVGDAGYFNDGGYSLAYNDAGWDQDAGTPMNDGGWIMWVGVPFNDGGYILVPNDGGYTLSTTIHYNDGGYSIATPFPYNDGGYCHMVSYNDGGTLLNDGGAVDQLNTANGADNQPSRTVIDRNGNVWVVLRATDGTHFFQSGATKIIDVDDHLIECVPRCTQRQGLMPNQAFTEGVPLTQSDGGTVTLSPPGIIAPGSAYATLYPCLDVSHDHTGAIETDAVNYDDCIRESIPLGSPYPDPNADPHGFTNGLNFGRAAAIAPNCDPSTADCDVWVGMWNGAGWIRLSYNGAGSGIPFDVGSVIYPGASPYGAAVDCAGIIWGTGTNALGADVLTATSTVAVTDPATLVSVPAYTVMSDFAVNNNGVVTDQYGIPKPATNYHYGIASDINQNIWSAAGEGGPLASSFNAKKLFTILAGLDAGFVSQSLFQQGLNLGWSTYDFSSIAPGPSFQPFGNVAGNGAGYARGINVDRYNNVYVGIDIFPWQQGGQGTLSFSPNIAGTIPCILYDGGSCQAAQLNWAYSNVDAGGHGGTVGVDIDAQGNPWAGNYGQPQGLAVQFSAFDGGILNEVPVGNGTYSYSDFTGYALRYITLQRAVYQQSVAGCGVSPELTVWNSLSYTAELPTGTDLQIDVRVTNSLNPAVISAATDYTVCDSVSHPANAATTCPRNADQSLNLSYFNLPQGYYLTVFVTLSPSICGGGSSQANSPTLYDLATGQSCSGN